MNDLLSRKIQEEYLKYGDRNPSLELSPQTVLEQTDLVSYCRLYKLPNQEEKGRINFLIRDILDFTFYISSWFPNLGTVKEYLDLFSQESQLYKLKQWFDEQPLPLSHFSHITYNIKTCFSGAREESRHPKNIEQAIELLNTEPAKAFHLQYGGYCRAYEAVIGTALEDVAKAKEIASCLNDEEVKARFLDFHVSFPEKVWHRIYANQSTFRDGILRKTMQDPTPDAVLKFIEKNKRLWIALFREEAL